MKNSYELLEEAISHYNDGNYELAIETAAGVSGDKEYAFSYSELMAHCYYGLEQFSNAVSFYEEALAIHQGNVVLQSRLGAAFDLSGASGKAFPIFESLYNAYPGVALHAYQLGNHLLGQQQHEKALSYLLEACRLDAGVHTDINFQIGVCYHNQNQWNKALAFLKAQATVKDGIADCYHLMGNCYRNLYQDDKAIAAYSQAIWYNENHDDAYWQRFLTKKDNGDYEGAEQDIRKALSINPTRLTLTDKDGSPLSIAEINVNRTNGNVDFSVNKENR